jgi:hypothetical protein
MTPFQKELIVGWILAVFSAILTALVIFGVSGCASHKPTGNETAALSGHIENVQENLSRVDGKAVVIEAWLRHHGN